MTPATTSPAPLVKRPPAIVMLGFLMFVVAFFVPAAWLADTTFPGYYCAFVGFNGIQDMGHLQTALLFISDLINPFLMFYIALRLFDGSSVLGRVLVAMILLIFIPATYIFLFVPINGSHPGIKLLVGHYLWMGGILLILAPEILTLGKKRVARSL